MKPSVKQLLRQAKDAGFTRLRWPSRILQSVESQANKKGDHSASIAAGSLDKYNAGRHLSPLAVACPADACIGLPGGRARLILVNDHRRWPTVGAPIPCVHLHMHAASTRCPSNSDQPHAAARLTAGRRYLSRRYLFLLRAQGMRLLPAAHWLHMQQFYPSE